jgi:hypothetical protein
LSVPLISPTNPWDGEVPTAKHRKVGKATALIDFSLAPTKEAGTLDTSAHAARTSEP